ncbi:MAG: hypothetical protein QXT45_05730 [Candidatus Bilamarchaeaceae archaeon]
MRLEDWPESIKIEIKAQCQFDSSICLSKDGYKVEIREGFWNGLDEKQKESLLDHIIAHVTRGDLLAMQAINDSQRWHTATDAVINSYLDNLPPGSVRMEDVAPELYSEGCPPPPAESVWRRLKAKNCGRSSDDSCSGDSKDGNRMKNSKDEKNGNDTKERNDGKDDKNENAGNTPSNDSKDAKSNDMNNDAKESKDDKNENAGNAPSNDSKDAESSTEGGRGGQQEGRHEMTVDPDSRREDIGMAHLRTIHDLISKGYSVGKAKDVVLSPSVEYPKRSTVKNVLERIILMRCKDCSGPVKESIRSWARENRSSEYLPGRIRRRRARIVVAVDVSGSMADLIGRTTAIAKTLKSEYDIIPVVWADSAEVYGGKGKYCVGSGTQPENMLKMVEELRADHIVVVTDGEFAPITPKKELPPITWVTTKWSKSIETRNKDRIIPVKASQL